MQCKLCKYLEQEDDLLPDICTIANNLRGKKITHEIFSLQYKQIINRDTGIMQIDFSRKVYLSISKYVKNFGIDLFVHIFTHIRLYSIFGLFLILYLFLLQFFLLLRRKYTAMLQLLLYFLRFSYKNRFLLKTKSDNR